MVPKGYLISYKITFLYGFKSLSDGPTAHLMIIVIAEQSARLAVSREGILW